MGESYLAAWQDLRNSSATSTNSDLFGVRIRPSGEIDGEDFPLNADLANDYYAALATGQSGAGLMVHERNSDAVSRVVGQTIGA